MQKKEGIEYFLVKPATDRLFSLYRKLGFNKDLFSENILISSKFKEIKENERVIEDIPFSDFSDFYNERENLLSNSSFLWLKDILSYSIKEILERNGFLLKASISGNFCIGYPSENGFILDFDLKNLDNYLFLVSLSESYFQ